MEQYKFAVALGLFTWLLFGFYQLSDYILRKGKPTIRMLDLLIFLILIGNMAFWLVAYYSKHPVT